MEYAWFYLFVCCSMWIKSDQFMRLIYCCLCCCIMEGRKKLILWLQLISCLIFQLRLYLFLKELDFDGTLTHIHFYGNGRYSTKKLTAERLFTKSLLNLNCLVCLIKCHIIPTQIQQKPSPDLINFERSSSGRKKLFAPSIDNRMNSVLISTSIGQWMLSPKCGVICCHVFETVISLPDNR